ncbi:MAG: hypothetical protein ACM3H8_13675 [Sphingobacteriales bacterium]
MKLKSFISDMLLIPGILFMASCHKPDLTSDAVPDVTSGAVHTQAFSKTKAPTSGFVGLTGAFQVATLAGSGIIGNFNPIIEGTAYQARFNLPSGVARDANGNVYVADMANHVIRIIQPKGNVIILAGTGTPGFIDSIGLSAEFNSPSGVAVDASGIVYVADKNNNRIRKITPDGVVTTLAGNGTPGSTNGPGSVAQFNLPSGVAVDALGNVLVADGGNHMIRRITPAGFVSLVAGTGTPGGGDGISSFAQFNNPSGVAVDGSGNVYVADAGNNKIRKIEGFNVSTLAGSGTPGFTEGPGTAAQFNNPTGVAVDAGGNVWVADKSNQAIRQVTSAGVVSTLAGNGTAGFKDSIPAFARFNSPAGIAVDITGNLFVADQGNQRIREIGVLVVVSTLAGNGIRGFADGQGSSAQFDFPVNLVMDASGNLILAEGQRIRKITAAGVVSTVAGNGTAGYSGDGGPATSAQLHAPQDVAIDAAGNIYVADDLNNVIRRITPAGIISTWAGSGIAGFVNTSNIDSTPAPRFNNPRGIAVDTAGNLYVADNLNNAIRKITPNRVVSTLAGNGTQGFADGTGTAAMFNHPLGVKVDVSGNVYVTDNGNRRIRKITPAGVVSTLAGNGTNGHTDGIGTAALFSSPLGVALDGAGNVYISDDNRIRKITSGGVVTTVTGSTLDYYDGLLHLAQYRTPWGIVVAAPGTIYIADFSNMRIRKIQ